MNLVESFRDLGVKVNKELPTDYAEPAVIAEDSEGNEAGLEQLRRATENDSW